MIQPDRKSIPPVNDLKLENIPKVKEVSLKNGVSLFLIPAGLEDLMRLDFIFKAGQVFEDIPLQASSTNMMLLEGTHSHTAEGINLLLDYYGTFPNLFTEKDSAGLSIIFLNRHKEKIPEMCREILFSPSFPEKEFNILINNRLQRFIINREKVQNIARDTFFETIFSSQHPYGRQLSTTDFENISTDNLAAFHRKQYTTGNMTIIASGRIHDSMADFIDKLFGNIDLDKTEEYAEAPVLKPNEYPQKISVKKEGAIQTAIKIGKATINKTHPDYQGLKIVTMILGGYFGSRLMRNLREDKGYTYGVHAALSSLHQSGYFAVSTEVGSIHAHQAIEEIYREISILQQKPLEDSELEIVKGYMMGELLRLFDGPFSTADSFRSAWEFGLGPDYYFGYEEKIKTMTSEEIIHLARTYYNIKELIEVTAGP